MADLAQELLRMKNHIETSKTEAARTEGQITQIEKQRAEEFGCATDEEADAYILELEEDVARLENEIQTGVGVVKGELGWG